MNDEKIAIILEGLMGQNQLKKVKIMNCEIGKETLGYLLRILERREEKAVKELRLISLKGLTTNIIAQIIEEIVTAKL
jgi:hypothetical protein